MVNLFYEDIEILDLDPEFFVSWLSGVCLDEGKELGELSVICCNDNYLLELNQKHLNHDYFTDIITFDYSEGNTINGDLFVSIDRVKENASDNTIEFKDELNRVVVHGALHLLGYKDKSEEEADLMRRVLSKEKFRTWLSAFLPELYDHNFKLQPGIVSDREDGHLVHLDGLNYSRAWCLYGIAETLPEYGHLVEVANEHINHSLPNLIDGNYEGGHWLASFALLALSS